MYDYDYDSENSPPEPEPGPEPVEGSGAVKPLNFVVPDNMESVPDTDGWIEVPLPVAPAYPEGMFFCLKQQPTYSTENPSGSVGGVMAWQPSLCS